jgi:DNA-binding Lrp family transcriptional regulator
MVDRSIEALAAEFARRGQAEEFAVLVVFLEPGRGARSYAEAAARLGLSENNVKIRVYRMRARFRRLLEDRVRETLGAEPGELAEELRHLIRVLE